MAAVVSRIWMQFGVTLHYEKDIAGYRVLAVPHHQPLSSYGSARESVNWLNAFALGLEEARKMAEVHVLPNQTREEVLHRVFQFRMGMLAGRPSLTYLHELRKQLIEMGSMVESHIMKEEHAIAVRVENVTEGYRL